MPKPKQPKATTTGAKARAPLVTVEPAKPGRPTKLTPELAAGFCAAIEQGATYEIAAGSVGVRRSTVYNWLKAGEAEDDGDHAEFLDAVKGAEARCALAALVLVRGGLQGWQGPAWLLERRYRDDYGRPRLEIEPVGAAAEALAALLGVTPATLPGGPDAEP
jgi:hypothetical protein